MRKSRWRRWAVSQLSIAELGSKSCLSPHGFRVLISPAGRVHERAVTVWRVMIEEAVERGEMVPPFDVDRLAYILVCSRESMLYADLIAGREPDIELAAVVQRAVLQARQSSTDPMESRRDS